MTQVSLLFLEPNDSIRIISERLGVKHVFMNDFAFLKDKEELVPVFRSCMEEFWLLIIAIISNRSQFAPIVDDEAEIETEIIQLLFLGPCTHSQLDKHLPSRLSESPKFESILKKVSVFKYPGRIEDQGTYSLKDVDQDKIQPYYHHYSPKDRSVVEEKLKGRRKSLKKDEKEHVPNLPNLIHEPQGTLGENLDKLVVCDAFLDILTICLSNTSFYDPLVKICDNMIDILLYITHIAIQQMVHACHIPAKFMETLEVMKGEKDNQPVCSFS